MKARALNNSAMVGLIQSVSHVFFRRSWLVEPGWVAWEHTYATQLSQKKNKHLKYARSDRFSIAIASVRAFTLVHLNLAKVVLLYLDFYINRAPESPITSHLLVYGSGGEPVSVWISEFTQPQTVSCMLIKAVCDWWFSWIIEGWCAPGGETKSCHCHNRFGYGEDLIFIQARYKPVEYTHHISPLSGKCLMRIFCF